jgi:hypothetical protein
MEQYLNADIISHILDFLNKINSFNFLNIATFMKIYKPILFDKYVFDQDKCTKYQNRKYFRHIKCININIKMLNIYENLISLSINNRSFNVPIDFFPGTLKILEIKSTKFNQSLDHLPINLNELSIISNEFNQPLNHLPVTLKRLEIEGNSFSHDLDNLPESLKLLYIKCYNFDNLINFPSNLNSFEMHSTNFDQQLNFPKTLHFLYIFCANLNRQLIFPDDLKMLKFHYGCSRNICQLPNNLEELDLYRVWGGFAIDKFPKSLETLTMNECYVDGKLLSILPENLHSLYICHYQFNLVSHIFRNLPKKLTELTIYGNSNFRPLINDFPLTIKSLRINGKKYR